jgi:hypothetical protein
MTKPLLVIAGEELRPRPDSVQDDAAYDSEGPADPEVPLCCGSRRKPPHGCTLGLGEGVTDDVTLLEGVKLVLAVTVEVGEYVLEEVGDRVSEGVEDGVGVGDALGLATANKLPLFVTT